MVIFFAIDEWNTYPRINYYNTIPCPFNERLFNALEFKPKAKCDKAASLAQSQDVAWLRLIIVWLCSLGDDRERRGIVACNVSGQVVERKKCCCNGYPAFIRFLLEGFLLCAAKGKQQKWHAHAEEPCSGFHSFRKKRRKKKNHNKNNPTPNPPPPPPPKPGGRGL